MEPEPGPGPLGRVHEPMAVRTAVQPESRSGDHVDLDTSEVETAMPGYSLDSLAHNWQRVLG